MSLKIEKIEHLAGHEHSHREFKKQRNRKIRRVKQTEVPHIKHKGWEY